MKRFLAIMLAAAIVLSAATVFADVKADRSDITLSGEIRVRSLILKDTDMISPNAAGDTDANITAIKLKMEAKVDKAKAVVELQTGPSGFDKWGTNGNVGMAATGAPDFQNGDSADLYFRQAYLAFPIAGINVSIGHQLLSLGDKSYFDATKDGAAAILLTYPMGKKDVIGIGTIKVTDNGVYSPNAFSGPTGNDKNFHFAFASFDLGGHTLGLNISDMHDSIIASADLYNWGLTLSGKLAAVDYTLAGDMQSGKANGVNKNKGYHARAKLGSNVGPVYLSLWSSYYSGEKDGSDVKKFVNYLEDNYYETFVWGYFTRTVTTAGAADLGGTYGQGTPAQGGFWFNRIGANYAVTPKLKATAAYINIRGTYGSKAQFATVDSKKVGDEIDFMFAYTIGKNLVWDFETGYLMPSTAYKEANALRTDNALAVRNTISLMF